MSYPSYSGVLRGLRVSQQSPEGGRHLLPVGAAPEAEEENQEEQSEGGDRGQGGTVNDSCDAS